MGGFCYKILYEKGNPMPNPLLLAAVLVVFWILHNNLKWRFITGIFFAVLCIAFYERIEPLGAGVVYGAIALVVWFYSTITEKDSNEKS